MDRLIGIIAARPGSPLAGVLIVLIGLAVYVPGLFTIPPIDRDESRFAQASRQMLESVALPEADRDEELHGGGLVVPRVAGRDRLNKPPLIYWLQSASAWVSTAGNPEHDAIWMYRLPSVLGSLLAALFTWRLGCVMFDPRTGWLAAVFIAVCPMVVIDAHQARADQVLLAATTLAIWGLWLTTRQNPSRIKGPLLLWIGIALGVMTKGPITPLVIVLTAVSYAIISRRWRWIASIRPIAGALFVLAATGAWVWGVAQQVGWDDYRAIIWDEVFVRSGEAKEGHAGPPGYHLALMPALLFPGSMLVGLGFVRAWRRMRVDRDAAFLIAWILPAWIVFELVATKLPHYTLPMYPALALIGAHTVLRPGELTHPIARLGIVFWTVLGVAIMLGAATFAIPAGWDALTIAHAGIGVTASGVLIRAGFELWRGNALAAQSRAIIATLAVLASTFVIVLPRYVTLSHDLWGVVEENGASRPVAMTGYAEDSLVFWSRGRITRLADHELDSWLDAHPGGLLIVPSDRVGGTVTGVRTIAEVEGHQYSRGRHLTVSVVERAE